MYLNSKLTELQFKPGFNWHKFSMVVLKATAILFILIEN